MRHVVMEQLQDRSTQDEFIFSLRCSECGDVWNSESVRFSRAGVKPETPEKKIIYDTLYRMEKEAAMKRAAKAAVTMVSFCPICRRLVCDYCFMICEDLDMCQSCAERLQEKGQRVANRKNYEDK